MAHPNVQPKYSARLNRLVASVRDLSSDNPEARLLRNQKLIAENSSSLKDFFTKVEGRELTHEQMSAALIFDDVNVTIAAAGSGKTSVIAAKVAYAIYTKLFTNREILVLAFNADAAAELWQRVRNGLKQVMGRTVHIKARTFHSFGLSLLKPKPRLESLDRVGKRRFLRVYDQLLKNEPFKNALLEWILYYRFPEPELEPTALSLEAAEQQYQRACKSIVSQKLHRKRRRLRSAWQPSIPTIDPGIWVRSMEEARIANWLLLHGVPFKYEEPVWKDWVLPLRLSKTEGSPLRPYLPDFTYTDPASGHRIYHEHFGLNKDGKAPAELGGEKYERRAELKRKVFQDAFGWIPASRGTVLPFFETWSADFVGTTLPKLEQELRKRGIAIHDVDEDLRRQALQSFREEDDLEKFFLKFIKLFRSSGLSKQDVVKRAEARNDRQRALLFLALAFALSDAFEADLKRENAIDFSDMLTKGSEKLKHGNARTGFKLILIDEFQDTAKPRRDLIEAVRAQCLSEAVFFCVGDDWQSINRFAGSDIEIFRSLLPTPMKLAGVAFDTYYSTIERGTGIAVVPLSQTFRCAQGIADVARALVTKNPSQIDKKVESPLLPNAANTIRVVGHSDSADGRFGALNQELNRLATLDTNDGSSKCMVFLLCRYRKKSVLPEGWDPDQVARLTRAFAKRLDIESKTIHESKGLQADYVVIVGLDAGFRGFPAEQRNDPLLELILPPCTDPIEEERRLLYVALTRARKQAILLTANTRPSEFILNLASLNQFRQNITWVDLEPEAFDICPACKRAVLRYEERDGRLRCARWPLCGYSMKKEGERSVNRSVM